MSREQAKQSFKSILLRTRPLLRRIRKFRGCPEAIAGGFGRGIFIALTPTVGAQLIIAIFLATLLKVSRPAALIAVMVTNPVTVPPIFTFNYWVGSFFMAGPSVADVYSHFMKIAAQVTKLNIWEVGAQIKAFAETGQEMLIPLLLGSLLVATFSGFIVYYVLLRLLRFLMFHRDRRKGTKDTT